MKKLWPRQQKRIQLLQLDTKRNQRTLLPTKRCSFSAQGSSCYKAMAKWKSVPGSRTIRAALVLTNNNDNKHKNNKLHHNFMNFVFSSSQRNPEFPGSSFMFYRKRLQIWWSRRTSSCDTVTLVINFSIGLKYCSKLLRCVCGLRNRKRSWLFSFYINFIWRIYAVIRRWQFR